MSHRHVKLAGMSTDHFTPHASHGLPCWHCQHFAGFVSGGVHAACELTGSRRIQATPATGCAFWRRVPGVDDELGPPAFGAVSRAGESWFAATPVAAVCATALHRDQSLYRGQINCEAAGLTLPSSAASNRAVQ